MKYSMEINSNGYWCAMQGRRAVATADRRKNSRARHGNISAPGCVLKSADPFSSPPLMDDASANAPFIIRGITTRGARFRPSDWTERLAGAFAVVDPNHRTNYSPYVQPTTLDGIPCVVVDKKLRDSNPTAYRFLQNFAESNELVTENAG